MAGECLLLIEGEERKLWRAYSVHCPPFTAHVLIGAGDGPCVIVAVSTRDPESSVRYIAAEVAKKHDAAPPHDTEYADEAYADTPPPRIRRYLDGDLPRL